MSSLPTWLPARTTLFRFQQSTASRGSCHYKIQKVCDEEFPRLRVSCTFVQGGRRVEKWIFRADQIFLKATDQDHDIPLVELAHGFEQSVALVTILAQMCPDNFTIEGAGRLAIWWDSVMADREPRRRLDAKR